MLAVLREVAAGAELEVVADRGGHAAVDARLEVNGSRVAVVAELAALAVTSPSGRPW